MSTIPLTAKAILSTTFINAFDICNGRLTLTSGIPVTTADVTAATTLYWQVFTVYLEEGIIYKLVCLDIFYAE